MSITNFPENDPDLQLAQQIGTHLENEMPLSDIEDPIIQVLLEYKSSTQSQEHDSPDKTGAWKKINQRTQSADSRSTVRFLSIKSGRYRAAAAVMLIVALLGVLYLQFYGRESLIAQSQSTVETVQLADGSTVTLRPYSSLYVIEEEAISASYRLEGEGLFNVVSNPKRTFSVVAGTGKVSVLGTRFTVSTWGNRMQVYLAEGSVKVEALQQDKAVVLRQGESAVLTSKTSVPKVNPAQAREYMDWIDQKLVFENKPAEYIIRELEQQFNVSITIPQGISGAELTGQLSLESLQTSFNDLELVLGGEFVQTAENRYVFEQK